MKALVIILSALTISVVACKPKTAEKTPEQEKAQQIIKTDKEKSDSVLKHYQQLMDEKPDTLPEMK